MPSSLMLAAAPVLGVMMRPASWAPVPTGANLTDRVQVCPEDKPVAVQLPPGAIE